METPAPATMLRRPRRDSQRKSNAILKGATRLFLKDGFSATSMDAVALAANVSKRTVYGHYGSKEKLYAVVVKRLTSEILPQSATEPGKGRIKDDVETRFIRIGIAFLSSIYTVEQIRLFWLLVSESREHPAVGRMMYDGPIKSSRAVLRAFLDDLVRQQVLDIEDTERAAIQYLAMLKMDTQMRLLLNCRATPTAEEIDATAEACARQFLYGAIRRG